jgi:predicted PurR-regulated permease PerM
MLQVIFIELQGASNVKSHMTTAQVLVTLAALASLGYLVYASQEVVMTGLLGVGIGVLLSPLLTFAQKKFRLPRALSAVIFLILFLGFTTLFVLMIRFLVADQFEKLSASAPQLIQNLKARLVSLTDEYPAIVQQIQSFNFQDEIAGSMSRVLLGLKSGFFAIASIGLALFLGLYTAVDSEEYFSGAIQFLPPSKRIKAAQIAEKCANVLRIWFRAQLMDMAIIGVSMAVVLRIVNMEYWAIFALLTAVLCIIPYAGIIIVIFLAAIVTLASDPAKVPWVIGAILIVQQLEANVVLPRVMRDQAELPELPLLVFMLLMGNWFGLVGVFMAPAVLAILKTLYHEIYQPWLRLRDTRVSK